MLRFSNGNAKLTRGEAIFDLPAGHSCPFACKCKSLANRITGKITDGKDIEFRCYAASLESRLPNVRLNHWNNFEMLKGKTKAQMVKLIKESLPLNFVFRIHSSGDFFSQAYFDAWMEVARNSPKRIFYAYTKALPYWVKRLDSIPKNFVLNASFGGTHDHLISKHNLKSVKVVYSEEQAAALGLALDHDDSHAWEQNKSFALLIHGTQPVGSEAGRAWEKVKRAGGGYGR